MTAVWVLRYGNECCCRFSLGARVWKARVVWESMRKKSPEQEQDCHRSVLMIAAVSSHNGPSEEDTCRVGGEVCWYGQAGEVGGEDVD